MDKAVIVATTDVDVKRVSGTLIARTAEVTAKLVRFGITTLVEAMVVNATLGSTVATTTDVCVAVLTMPAVAMADCRGWLVVGALAHPASATQALKINVTTPSRALKV